MSPLTPLDPRLFELGLDHVEPNDFERFGQSFYGALEGKSFVPLGGQGDGGADGLMDRSLVIETGAARVLQISKSTDHRAKIRNTVQRLREYGREFRGLTYLTSVDVRNSDSEEDHLSEQLGVPVRIRDRGYIVAHINHSAQTIQAGSSFVMPSISFLNKVGSAQIIPKDERLPAQSLCVFLSQEVDRRRGNTELLISLTDSLILWSLDQTDPAKDLFMTEADILAKISEALPAAAPFVRQNLTNRLSYLARKDNTTGRQINYHRARKAYCLPYETRLKVAEENTSDAVLKATVTEQFRIRLSKIAPIFSNGSLVGTITDACHHAVTGIFRDQGLEVAAFLEGARHFEASSSLDKYVHNFLEKNTTAAGREFAILRGAALEVLRQALYESSEVERRYFQKLSRTYALLFTLKNDPKVVDYFHKMTGKFVLYVGSDIIVRALSEHYLRPEDQMTGNLLRILKSAGSKLILSEKALGEVVGHLRKTRNAWEYEYCNLDASVDVYVAQQIPLMLMRAYYYAKLHPVRDDVPSPRRFPDFVNQFVTYSRLRHDDGAEEIRDYLCSRFSMEFEETEAMEQGISEEEIAELTEKIVNSRVRAGSEDVLARNDALQVLRVYKRRQLMSERSGNNPFGYSTWWLTQESALLKATVELEKKKKAQFLIRPEFLLNYIALTPSMKAVRDSFEGVFPTILGVRLSNRMRENDFRKIIDSAKEMLSVDSDRAGVMLAKLSNRLKADRSRDFEVAFEAPE